MSLCFSAFAAEKKVVVIPLSSSPAVVASEGVDLFCYFYMTVGYGSDHCIFDEIPSGKVLVVEFISGDLLLPIGQSGHIKTNLFKPGGGGGNHHTLYLRYQRPYNNTTSMYIVSQPIKIYVDEEYKLGIQAYRTDTSGVASGDFRITGYLIDKNNK